MKRIGILATARQGNGGTLLYTHSMIDALRRLPSDRYQFTIIAEADNQEYDHIGLPVVRLPGWAKPLLSRLAGGGAFAEFDALISPVYSTWLLVSVRPFCFTLHDLQERYHPQNFSPATRIWRRATNRALTSRARRIICESNFVKRDIVRFLGVPENKVAVIPAPPIALLCQSPPDTSEMALTRQKFSLPDIYVFYPAQFWPHKNHLRLLEAFAEVVRVHPQAHLVLTGKPRDEYVKVMKRIESLGLASRVLHIGYVERTELATLYRCATAVAVPTLFESISIPVYEAFALGTAVCVSNVVALPEQVGDAGLLFDPLSVTDIAGKINALLADAALRDQLVERGRRRIESVTHEQYARGLADVLDVIDTA